MSSVGAEVSSYNRFRRFDRRRSTHMADDVVESGLEYEEVRLEMHAQLVGGQYGSSTFFMQ